MDPTVIEGGVRVGAGRPKKQSGKKERFSVSLSALQNKILIEKYGSLTKALQALLITASPNSVGGYSFSSNFY